MNNNVLYNLGDTIITKETLREDVFNMIDLLYNYLFNQLSKDIFEKSLEVYSKKLDSVLEFSNKSSNICKLYNDILNHLHSAEFVDAVQIDNQSSSTVYSKYMPVIQDIFYDKSAVKDTMFYISTWLHTYKILITIYEEDLHE